jgi:hypothetical protein
VGRLWEDPPLQEGLELAVDPGVDLLLLVSVSMTMEQMVFRGGRWSAAERASCSTAVASLLTAPRAGWGGSGRTHLSRKASSWLWIQALTFSCWSQYP